ncbi:MAG: phosphatase PAP2 family protein [Bilifractor sp.]
MLSAITNMDVAILVFIRDHLRFEWLTPVMQAVSAFGFFGWVVLTVVFLLFRRTRPVGRVCAVSLGIEAFLVNLVLKLLIARIRPFNAFDYLMPIGKLPTDYSFPSGHTANSFAVALVALHMLPKKAGIPLVVLASVVAYSRLYLGVHYPSDVICGFLVALIISQVVWYLMVRRPEKVREAAAV